MKELIVEIIKKSKKEIFLKVVTSLFVRGLLLIIPIYWSNVINNLTDLNFNKTYFLVVIVLILTILYYAWEYLNQKSWFAFYDKLYIEYTNILCYDVN